MDDKKTWAEIQKGMALAAKYVVFTPILLWTAINGYYMIIKAVLGEEKIELGYVGITW